MTDVTHLETTRRDYDSMAVRYAEFVQDPVNAEPFGRALIGVFADLVGSRGANGTAVDVGCGPGHRTDLLAHLGLSVHGIARHKFRTGPPASPSSQWSRASY
ncbi:MAG: hypothetical protein ACRDQ6_17185 [Pseudonocardiaceae bacterium]